jgi:two-component system chemotaxis response regulator CheB
MPATLSPNRRIRVLVVDDSVVIRRLVTHVLSSDPELEVVGYASNGSIALGRIPQVNPDVVTLDIEMPEVDGLEVLRRARSVYPELYFIMFSTLTERGAVNTLDALALGANDYVTKAANGGSLDRSLDVLKDQLIPKIKQFFRSRNAPPPPPPQVQRTTTRPAAIQPVQACTSKPELLVVGSSTGGPNALSEVLPVVAGKISAPILVVQHMPPLFTRFLAERLDQQCAAEVKEAVTGDAIRPGRILIAPGDYHLKVQRDGASLVAVLDQAAPENSCRPSVDVLFRTAAEASPGRVAGMILTGMGQDGLRGAEELKRHGGWLAVQDEATSVVWGMPGVVAKAGLADTVLSLKQLGPAVIRIFEG